VLCLVKVEKIKGPVFDALVSSLMAVFGFKEILKKEAEGREPKADGRGYSAGKAVHGGEAAVGRLSKGCSLLFAYGIYS
jgi:hypothetical protein